MIPKINQIKNFDRCETLCMPNWCYPSRTKKRMASQYEKRFLSNIRKYMGLIDAANESKDFSTLVVAYAQRAIAAFETLMRLYEGDVIEKFTFTHDDELDLTSKYFEAISIYLNNPITTRRNDAFGVGEYITNECLSIDELCDGVATMYINRDGVSEVAVNNKRYHMFFIAKLKGDRFTRDVQLIFSMDDITHVLQLYVNKYIEIHEYCNNFSI